MYRFKKYSNKQPNYFTNVIMIHYYHLYYYLIVLYVVLLSCYFCSLCAWFSLLCFATFTLYNALTLRYLQQSFKQIGRLLGPVW